MSSKVVMSCGCYMDKQHVAQRLKDTFKNSYKYEIRCPRTNCNKLWDLSDIDDAIHLNVNDYEQYLDEIEKRSAPPTKNCPFCGKNCQRPTPQSTQYDIKHVYRVHCPCSSEGVDWCWECRKRWRTKFIDDCGNSNCHLNNDSNGNFRQQMNVEQSNNVKNTVDMIGINNKSKFYVGQKVKSLDPSVSFRSYYAAIITEVEHDRVKVKYDDWPSDSCDQWINQLQYDNCIIIESNNSGSNDNDVQISDCITKFHIGQKVKSIDPQTGKTTYYDATITEVEQDRVKVKYDKWKPDKYDQWIYQYNDYIKIETSNHGNLNDNDVQITDRTDNHTSNQNKFRVGQKVKSKDPSTSDPNYYNAKITEVKSDRVKVKYDKWKPDKYDQWINECQYDDCIEMITSNNNGSNNGNNTSSPASKTNIRNNKTKFRKNQRVKARSPANPDLATFFDGKIVQVRSGQVKVKYDKYPKDDQDEWIKEKQYHNYIRLIDGMQNNGRKQNKTRYNNGLVGLNNLGNTCFMNSALQCLLQCPDFIQLYLQDKIKLPQTSGWVSGRKINKQSLAYIFASFIKKIYTTNRGSIAPHNIKNALNKLNSRIGNGSQQDSFMVIETLLQGLEDELCIENQDGMVYDLDIFNEKDIPNNKQIVKKVNELWTQHINGTSNADYSVREIFDGVECEKTTCCVCSYQFRTFQTFRQIELPLCDKNISLEIKIYVPEISSYSLCTETLNVTYDNTMDGLKYIMLPKLINKFPKYKLNNKMNIKFGYINLSNNKQSMNTNELVKYMDKNDICSKIKCNCQILAVIDSNNKPSNVKYIPQFNLICNENGQFVRRVFVPKLNEKSNNYGDDIMTFAKVDYQKNNHGNVMNGKQIIEQESKVNKELQNNLINYKKPIIFYNNHIVNSSNVNMVKNGCLLRIWVHDKLRKQSPASVSKIIFVKNDQSTIQKALNNSSKINKNSWLDVDNILDAVGGYCRSLGQFTFYDLPNFICGSNSPKENIKEIEEKRNQAQETYNKLKTLSEAEKLANEWLSSRLSSINKFYQNKNINYTKPKMLDDLDECLTVYELSETSNANLLDCQRCTDLPEIVSRQVDILKTPKIFTIHIDREENKDDDYNMINNGNGYGKNNYYSSSTKSDTLIKYKINGLKFKGDIYDLFGMVEHYGYGTNAGHYAAYVRSLAEKRWYKMNDSSVSTINGNPPVSSNVSVLLYSKRN